MLHILDCTLRDGGYYTNWDFDDDLVNSYIANIRQLPINYVEVGYRNPLKEKIYKGEYFHLDRAKMADLKKRLGKIKLALMLDAKSVEAEEVAELLEPVKDCIDLVRIAANPNQIDQSIALGKAIANTGIPLALNIMYISTGAVNEEVIDKIAHCGYELEYLYLVDSYGGATPNQVKSLMQLISERTNVKIGFHAHNNLELALINTVTAIEAGAAIADVTVTGMGRGAGNLKTELLLTYLLGKGELDCDMEALGDLVDLFKPLLKKFKWGTNLPYMISGSFNNPQGTVMNWITTDRYSENDIIKKVMALGNGDSEKFNKIGREQIQQKDKALIIGGGPTVLVNKNKIIKLIKENEYQVLFTSTRYISDFVDYLDSINLCISGKQIHDLQDMTEEQQEKVELIILPNDTLGIDEETVANLRTKCFQFQQLTYPDKKEDSPLMLALEYAYLLNGKVELVGFDGYKNQTNKGIILNRVNQEIFNHYLNIGVDVISLTRTTYNIPTTSIHAITMN